MSAVKFEKDSEMFNFFRDYYRVVQKVWGVETSDEYWTSTIAATAELSKKYSGEYAIGMIHALNEELQRKEKELLDRKPQITEENIKKKAERRREGR